MKDIQLLNEILELSSIDETKNSVTSITTTDLPKDPLLPMISEKKYTLVLGLDETLIHYFEVTLCLNNKFKENECAFIQIRPNVDTFLEELSKYYELVLFTSATEDVIIRVLT